MIKLALVVFGTILFVLFMALFSAGIELMVDESAKQHQRKANLDNL